MAHDTAQQITFSTASTWYHTVVRASNTPPRLDRAGIDYLLQTGVKVVVGQGCETFREFGRHQAKLRNLAGAIYMLVRTCSTCGSAVSRMSRHSNVALRSSNPSSIRCLKGPRSTVRICEAAAAAAAAAAVAAVTPQKALSMSVPADSLVMTGSASELISLSYAQQC